MTVHSRGSHTRCEYKSMGDGSTVPCVQPPGQQPILSWTERKRTRESEKVRERATHTQREEVCERERVQEQESLFELDAQPWSDALSCSALKRAQTWPEAGWSISVHFESVLWISSRLVRASWSWYPRGVRQY
eukprot:1099570-Rhodomonas_salina.1